MDRVELLETKIKYWIRELRYPQERVRREDCERALDCASKEYKELTGEFYGNTRTTPSKD